MIFSKSFIASIQNQIRLSGGWRPWLKSTASSIHQSPDDPNDMLHFVAWVHADRGDYSKALKSFGKLSGCTVLEGWSHLGNGYIALQCRDIEEAENCFSSADNLAERESALYGALQLFRGVIKRNERQFDEALQLMEDAISMLPAELFGYSRALFELGTLFAMQSDFRAAFEFYNHAKRQASAVNDEFGHALNCAGLGRLYLDWGQNSLAETQFREAQNLCSRIADDRGETDMCYQRGLCALERGDSFAATGYVLHARELADSREWLDLLTATSLDYVRCLIAEDQPNEAYDQLQKARPLLHQMKDSEGLAHLKLLNGIVRRLQENLAQAERDVRAALDYFTINDHPVPGAVARLELALIYKANGVSKPVVRDAMLDAVDAAEVTRRPHLVQKADLALSEVDKSAYHQRVYSRSRGASIDEDVTSLVTADQDVVSVMFFDLKGFTGWSANTDPGAVILSLNQMMAGFRQITLKHNVEVIEYMGDGFLAIARGTQHAERAVRAAVELTQALERFNLPNRLLEKNESDLFSCRIGIATGQVVLGNIGTYDKIDYRAVGSVVNLASRLEGLAETGKPCISILTWELVQHRFVAQENSGRSVSVRGLNDQRVWDIIDTRTN